MANPVCIKKTRVAANIMKKTSTPTFFSEIFWDKHWKVSVEFSFAMQSVMVRNHETNNNICTKTMLELNMMIGYESILFRIFIRLESCCLVHKIHWII